MKSFWALPEDIFFFKHHFTEKVLSTFSCKEAFCPAASKLELR